MPTTQGVMKAGIRHLVIVPYPGRGHINPMMCLCRLLAARGDFLITFVVTEEWLSLLTTGRNASQQLPHGLRFRTIPNVVPSEKVRAANFVGFFEAVFTKMEAPFEELLDGLEQPPSAIVADTYLYWAVQVGRRRNIPVASFMTMPAAFQHFLYHHGRSSGGTENVKGYAKGWLQTANGDLPPAKEEDPLMEKYDHIPALYASRLSDFHSVILQPKLLQLALKAFSWAKKARALLFNSFYELEHHVFDAMRAEFPCPVYAVGPCIPHMAPPTYKEPMLVDPCVADCYNWLDSQTESSVLYVSLGSFLSVSTAQREEIALGLVASQTKFLWVARGDASSVQILIDKAAGTGGEGVIVPWCDQLKVLHHPCVGGFLSHCGWNSTLEAVYTGVPMLTFPIFLDQPLNGRRIIEEWKIGLDLKGKAAGKDGLVGRDVIAAAVRKMMDLDDCESKEMRRRAMELKVAALKAVDEEGSSFNDLNSFLDDLSV